MTRNPARRFVAPHRESLVSLSELILTLEALRPRTARARTALLDMLGFQPSNRQRARRRPPGPVPPRTVSPPPRPASSPPHVPRQKLVAARTEPPSDDARQDVSLPRAAAHDVKDPPPPEPLFNPRWTRDIIVSALATNAAVGEYDIEALVSLLAMGKPVAVIPRRLTRTLYRGAHVLIDIGEGMEPFAADQEGLVLTLQRIVGQGLVDVRSFKRTPAQCGGGPLWTWKPYAGPRTATPLLLLTDLGLGGPAVSAERASKAEWLQFLNSVARDVPIIVLSPYAPSRQSRLILGRCVGIRWDRMTTPRRAWLARSAAKAGR